MTSEFRRSQHSNWEMVILKGEGAYTPPGNMPAGMRSPPEQAAEAEVGPVIRSTSVFHVQSCVLYMFTMCITCVCPLCMPCVCHLYFMCFPCKRHVDAMTMPCVFHRPIGIPCVCHAMCHLPHVFHTYVCHAMCIPYVCHPSARMLQYVDRGHMFISAMHYTSITY